MGKINKNYYDDEWILTHAHEYKRWSDMHKTYLKTHPHHQINIKNFRQHLNKRLKLKHRYTKEMDEWLMENYPHLGAKECFRQFCEYFNVTKGFQGFKSHINELGLGVTEQRWREACLNNGYRENAPIGTITCRGRNNNMIKVAPGTDGWIPLPHYLLGKPKKNEMVVHLDGDSSNDDLENLMLINRKVGAKMTGNDFWKEEPILTKTAIICCQLECELEERG